MAAQNHIGAVTSAPSYEAVHAGPRGFRLLPSAIAALDLENGSLYSAGNGEGFHLDAWGSYDFYAESFDSSLDRCEVRVVRRHIPPSCALHGEGERVRNDPRAAHLEHGRGLERAGRLLKVPVADAFARHFGVRAHGQ